MFSLATAWRQGKRGFRETREKAGASTLAVGRGEETAGLKQGLWNG